MFGLDPGLVVHMLNVETEAKSVAQLASVPYRNKGADSKGGAKATGRWFYQAHPAPMMVVQYCTSKEEEWADKILCRLQKSQPGLPKR